MNTLTSIAETKRLIASGASLALAASARALAQLPAGNWIGGTSHYFTGPDGGVKTDNQVFVTDLGQLGQVSLSTYGPDEIARVAVDTPEQGFSLVIIPAGTRSLRNFAQRPYGHDLFLKAIVGWVAGVDLANLRSGHAQVVDGRSGRFENDAIVAAHVTLPPGKMPSISIINPFEISKKNVLHFDEVAFSTSHCVVDGKKTPLAEFLIQSGYANGKLPLIGDFSGAAINVSIQAVECVSGRVDFYAPVFPNVDYYLAKPITDYSKIINEAIVARNGEPVTFSCNCILNYLHGNLEGKRTGNVLGPVTFGEIAYQLLNQTMVVLDIV